MEAYATNQLKELNQAKLFRSACTVANLIQGSQITAQKWKQFRLEKAKAFVGLASYEPAIYELSQLVHTIAIENQKLVTTDPVRLANLQVANQAKLLHAECYFKKKQYSVALNQYKSVPSRDHTLESMMNMATCVTQLESEHNTAKIYVEILNRWPFALEAAYELIKLGIAFDQVLASPEIASALEAYKSGQAEANVQKVALGWVASLYQDWNFSLDSYRGGAVTWKDIEAKRPESLASQQQLPPLERQVLPSEPSSALTTTEKPSSLSVSTLSGSNTGAVSSSSAAGQVSSSGPLSALPANLQLSTPIRGSDSMHITVCAHMELYKGDMARVIALYERLKPEARLLGVEYLGWARLRLGQADELYDLQQSLARQYPANWETWYVSALREWLGDPARRNVNGGLEMLGRAMIVSPTNTLLLITRAYMYVYKVKDCLLRLNSPVESESTIKRLLGESTKAAAECVRDARSLSKDPFVTHAVMHIYGLLAPLLPESKIIEVVAEMDALNPLFKRFKAAPQAVLAQAANNSSLAAVYARLLARKAKLCCSKAGLAQMAIDVAAQARSFEPANILAQLAAIHATCSKSSSSVEETVRQMEEVLKKADTLEEMNTARLEMLALLSAAGRLERAKELSETFYNSNRLNEDAIYWYEDTRMKIERLAEEEDEGDEEDAEGEE